MIRSKANLLLAIILGTKEVVAKKNKLGYFYYIGILVFIKI